MKKATSKNYAAICKNLGFDPDSHFVKITNRGTISFTCGKPNEIRALLKACEDCGYKASKALCDAVR